MRKVFIILFAVSTIGSTKILEVGSEKQFTNLRQAAQNAQPGDTLLFYPGIYSGGQAIANLQGSESNEITIMVQEKNSVIIRGGSTAWQLTDAAYVRISGFVFENQTANGVNFDDGGEYSTPAHHITFENCTFKDINATGNNDLLKLSGVDDFVVRNCTFQNGSPNGSGIDMVGCHKGEIVSCIFENMGSNAIQAKGGSQHILIHGNWFANCGHRAVNLGGSTGLPYFRPADAKFEAADLNVFSNVFIGTMAPIAYVGCVRTHVINNTIINPEKWVVRILQENVDPNRFFSCGDNSFQNNLIYQKALGTETNVGGNTRPESFIFKSNFWYNYENDNWPGPSIPATDSDQIINKNPLFKDFAEQDFSLQPDSPAAGVVNYNGEPQLDFNSAYYKLPRSVGAFESNPETGVYWRGEGESQSCQISPNPFNSFSRFTVRVKEYAEIHLYVYDVLGRRVLEHQVWHEPGEHQITCDFSHASSGIYFYQLANGSDFYSGKLTLVR